MKCYTVLFCVMLVSACDYSAALKLPPATGEITGSRKGHCNNFRCRQKDFRHNFHPSCLARPCPKGGALMVRARLKGTGESGLCNSVYGYS